VVPLSVAVVVIFIVEVFDPFVMLSGLDVNDTFGQLGVSDALKVTDPVNPPLGVTVTVKLAVLPPRTEALVGDTETVKPCEAAATVCVMLADVLPMKLVSPPYCAVIACCPAESEEVDSLAPPPLRPALPRLVLPS